MNFWSTDQRSLDSFCALYDWWPLSGTLPLISYSCHRHYIMFFMPHSNVHFTPVVYTQLLLYLGFVHSSCVFIMLLTVLLCTGNSCPRSNLTWVPKPSPKIKILHSVICQSYRLKCTLDPFVHNDIKCTLSSFGILLCQAYYKLFLHYNMKCTFWCTLKCCDVRTAPACTLFPNGHWTWNPACMTLKLYIWPVMRVKGLIKLTTFKCIFGIPLS